MRKFLITTLIAGSTVAIGLGAVSAQAEPSGACSSGQVPGTVAASPPGGTSGIITICATKGPVTGNITASGNATTRSGYIVADGDSTNSNPSNALQGYAGIDSANGGVEVVGCSTGGYSYGGQSEPTALNPTSDHELAGVNGSGQVTQPSTDTTDACGANDPSAP